jgi:hypothetical protein
MKLPDGISMKLLVIPLMNINDYFKQMLGTVYCTSYTSKEFPEKRDCQGQGVQYRDITSKQGIRVRGKGHE